MSLRHDTDLPIDFGVLIMQSSWLNRMRKQNLIPYGQLTQRILQPWTDWKIQTCTTTLSTLGKTGQYLEPSTDYGLVEWERLMDTLLRYVLISYMTLDPNQHLKVDYPELNAAWGQVLLLLQVLARKLEFTFER